LATLCLVDPETSEIVPAWDDTVCQSCGTELTTMRKQVIEKPDVLVVLSTPASSAASF